MNRIVIMEMEAARFTETFEQILQGLSTQKVAVRNSTVSRSQTICASWYGKSGNLGERGGGREEVRENGENFVTKTYIADHSGRPV